MPATRSAGRSPRAARGRSPTRSPRSCASTAAGSRRGDSCARSPSWPPRRGRPRPRARRRGRDRRRPAAARGSPGPTGATGTGRAPSRSTSRSRAACPGRTRPAGGPGPSTWPATSRRSRSPSATINRGRMPERPFVLVGQQYLADPSARSGDLHPVWAYAHVPSGYAGDATEADPRPDRALRPGLPRADRGHARSAIPPTWPPTTPTTSAATSSPAPTRRSRS